MSITTFILSLKQANGTASDSFFDISKTTFFLCALKARNDTTVKKVWHGLFNVIQMLFTWPLTVRSCMSGRFTYAQLMTWLCSLQRSNKCNKFYTSRDDVYNNSKECHKYLAKIDRFYFPNVLSFQIYCTPKAKQTGPTCTSVRNWLEVAFELLSFYQTKLDATQNRTYSSSFFCNNPTGWTV